MSAAGLGMLGRAEERLERSAQAFTKSAADDGMAGASSDATASAASPDGIVDAAVEVIYGRSEFRIGVALIEVGRDTEKQLLDVLA